MKAHRLVLLGPPASGKGTQGRLLEARWQVPVVSVGDVLRKEIANRTVLGQEAAGYLDAGKLAPDHVAVAAVEAWLGEAARQSFMFDGFPRTVGQARALEELLARHRVPLTAAIWLDLDDASIAHRVSRRLTCEDCGHSFQIGTHVASTDEPCPVCGGHLTVRADDDPAALAERLEQYRRHTEPVKDFYDARGLLHTIASGQPPEDVFAQIEAATAHPREAAAAA